MSSWTGGRSSGATCCKTRATPRAIAACMPFANGFAPPLRSNMPLDRVCPRDPHRARQFRSTIPPRHIYAVSKDPDDTIQRVTQVFCGVRMLCARCHPHPFEHWTQGDYYGLHSFFNQVSIKPDPRQMGVVNAKTILLNLAAPSSTNPRTGQAAAAALSRRRRAEAGRRASTGAPITPAGSPRRKTRTSRAA